MEAGGVPTRMSLPTPSASAQAEAHAAFCALCSPRSEPMPPIRAISSRAPPEARGLLGLKQFHRQGQGGPCVLAELGECAQAGLAMGAGAPGQRQGAVLVQDRLDVRSGIAGDEVRWLAETKLLQPDTQLAPWIEKNFAEPDGVRDVAANIHYFAADAAELTEILEDLASSFGYKPAVSAPETKPPRRQSQPRSDEF